MKPHALPIVCAVMVLICSCTGVVPVKDVENDKLGYLKKTFAVQTVPDAVVSQINARDNLPVSFNTMVVSLTPQFENRTPGAAQPNYHNTLTFINGGGPFVQVLEEQSSNGVDTRQEYGVAYRNLLFVRQQMLRVNETSSGLVMEMKSLKSFAPVSLAGPSSSLNYEYEWGNHGQIANFSAHAVRCDYGQRYPASRLHPKLLGDAQDLHCDYVNSNGVVTAHAVRTLLVNYGVAVMTHNQSASATVSFKIDDVRVN
jgi:hypothetical protein